MRKLPVLTREELTGPRKAYVKVASRHLFLNALRLDASLYSSAAFAARKVVSESGYALLTVSELVGKPNIFNPPPLKRYFSDSANGTPYLMPSELFLFRPVASKYVFSGKIPGVDRWYVKEGWLLITQSGLPGLPIITTHDLEHFVISQNLIRIIPEDGQLVGYWYAVLSSWIGQALLMKNQFGITVEHIMPEHVGRVPVPQLPEDVQRRIHTNIMKAYGLRERGRELLREAEQLLLKEMPAESLNDATQAYSVPCSGLNLRLDASYHEPLVRKTVELLRNSTRVAKLADTAEVFVAPRFKRIYVNREMGVPFIQGAHTTMMKPIGLKYISKLTKGLSNWVVSAGTILVTCSGTIGRVSLVPKAWDGWAVSQHALRILPDEGLNPGYLATFLATNWGYLQVVSKTYGGVVDEIDEEGMKEVIIPVIDDREQKDIGARAIEAFGLREKANRIEDATVRTLEGILTDRRGNDRLDSYIERLETMDSEREKTAT